MALLHGLGSGSDTRLSVTLAIDVVCVGAVAGAGAWRLVTGRSFPPGRRVLAALAGILAILSIGVVAVVGPLRSGWSHRAGTSPALLAQLNASFQSGGAASGASGIGSTTTAAGGAQRAGGTTSTAGLPPVPFTSAVQGDSRTSPENSQGEVTVVLTMQPSAASGNPLVVKLIGQAVNGGVAMSTSHVTWGPDSGTVSSLEGSSIGASLTGPTGTIHVALHLSLDQTHGTFTGTMTASKDSTRSESGE